MVLGFLSLVWSPNYTASMGQTVSSLIGEIYKAEARKLTYTIARAQNLPRYGDAEDVVQFAFERALETWQPDALPANPVAWLYQVARNKAMDIGRAKTKTTLVPDYDLIVESHQNVGTSANPTGLRQGEDTDLDATLAMAFVCCHPGLPPESQLALALRTLFSLSVDEVARALCIKYDNAEKRLTRARKAAQSLGIMVEPPRDLSQRLPGVLRILYLCFNEGYYSRSKDPIRFDLCTDTLALLNNLVQHPSCQTTEAYALLALMCFHCARLGTRVGIKENTSEIEAGSEVETAPDQEALQLLSPAEQNRANYNATLITYGKYYLNQAATGTHISAYHLEAAIAATHCAAPTWAETDWQLISNYYQQLLQINPSTMVRLGYWVALWKADGAAAVLPEFLASATPMADNYFYQSLGQRLMEDLGELDKAEGYKQAAFALALTPTERTFVTTT